MARLYAKICEHTNFAGQHRFVTGDVRDVSNEIGFNDTISSIIVYKGNQHQPGDRIRFYEHPNFGGGYLDLEAGIYPNIHVQPYSFGDRISSIDVNPPPMGQVGIVSHLWVRIYQHANYGGQYRDLLLSESHFEQIGMNDAVSSLRVMAGEDYAPGYVCDFFAHPNYTGPKLQPGNFEPGTSIPNIGAAPYSFNDAITSMRVTRQT